MASSTISLLPRITRVLQVGDQLVADVAQTNGSTLTLRVDAADLFGGVVAALKTMAVVLDALTAPTITFDGSSSIATDGNGNVTHTGQQIKLAAANGLILVGAVDISTAGLSEPAAGSQQLFVDGGFVKCAV